MSEETSAKPLPSNVFELADFNADAPPQMLQFYEKGIEDMPDRPGTTVEEVLRVLHARLTDLNDRFACDENLEAIGAIEVAQEALARRTADRVARGVEGKHEA